MNKPHLPTFEEVEKNFSNKTLYICTELTPESVRERIKKHLGMSKLERQNQRIVKEVEL